MLGENSRHELSAAADADLVEYRLEVVLHGVWWEVQTRSDLASRAPLEDELGNGR